MWYRWLFLLLMASTASAEMCMNEAERQAQVILLQQQIEDARHCQSDSDCALVYPGCPVACAAAVNKQYIQALEQGFNDYQQRACQRCMYKCARTSEARCIEQRCQRQ